LKHKINPAQQQAGLLMEKESILEELARIDAKLGALNTDLSPYIGQCFRELAVTSDRYDECIKILSVEKSKFIIQRCRITTNLKAKIPDGKRYLLAIEEEFPSNIIDPTGTYDPMPINEYNQFFTELKTIILR
jgi:hypothetical protein